MKIVTLTLNPALDKSSTTEQLVPEKKLRCENPQIDAGGGGINVSKGIARLGGRSTAVFPIGGSNGKKLEELVKSEGISTKTIQVSGETRENFSIFETSTNFQYRFTMAGEKISQADAQRLLDAIEKLKPHFLVASGSLPPGLPPEYFEKVAAFAKKIGAKFILDTSGEALAAAADEGLFLLKPNLGELSALVGEKELAMNQVDDAALEIINQGKCEVVVVSLGPQGALLVTKSGFEHIPAPPVKIKTTVGAGDSMVAGMVWALSEKKNFSEMAKFGVACGSAATLNQGTQLFHRDDMLKLKKWLDEYGEKYRIHDF